MISEIAALLGVQRLRPPIVEDEQIDAGERAQQLGVSSVAAGEREGGEQTRHAMIEDGQVFPAGLLAEGTGEPAFADAAGAGDQQITSRADPVAGGELEEQRAIEPAGSAVVDVLDAGGMAQPAARARARTASGGAASPHVRAGGRAIRHVRARASRAWLSSALKPLAMPWRPRACSRSSVGCGQHGLFSVSGSSAGPRTLGWSITAPVRRSGENGRRSSLLARIEAMLL